MARKRKLDAGIPNQPSDQVVADEPTGAIGGFWGGSAVGLLKQRIDEVHGSIVQGILSGTVVLSLAPDQIEDEIGSDRVGEWADDDEFKSLLTNIKRRGQTQPIRVRPKDPSWAPNPEDPLKIAGAFFVQSGRRRIEVCRRLGIPVLAILSTEEGDAALADLEERYFENTNRQDLTGFEELLSIGHIAQRLGDLSQSEIAEHLHVTQNDVSLGVSCVELRDEILKFVDVSSTPKRAFRSIIPKLRSGADLSPSGKAAKKDGTTIHYQSNAVKVELRRSGRDLTFKVNADAVDEADLNEIAKRVAAVFDR